MAGSQAPPGSSDVARRTIPRVAVEPGPGLTRRRRLAGGDPNAPRSWTVVRGTLPGPLPACLPAPSVHGEGDPHVAPTLPGKTQFAHDDGAVGEPHQYPAIVRGEGERLDVGPAYRHLRRVRPVSTSCSFASWPSSPVNTHRPLRE